MKSQPGRRSPQGILRGALWGAAVAVCMCDLRAGEPKSPPSDELAKRTLRALGEAAHRRPRRSAPSLDEVTLPASSPAAVQTADPPKRCLDTRPLEPRPLESRPLEPEPQAAEPWSPEPQTRVPPATTSPSEDQAGWYSADRRGKMARRAPSKPAPPKRGAMATAAPKTIRTEAARASVRWADAREDDGEAVRPAADWRGAATVTMRGTAGRSNPLRNGDRRDQGASSTTRRTNPLRAK